MLINYCGCKLSQSFTRLRARQKARYKRQSTNSNKIMQLHFIVKIQRSYSKLQCSHLYYNKMIDSVSFVSTRTFADVAPLLLVNILIQHRDEGYLVVNAPHQYIHEGRLD